ncbi:MAG: squalene/phytoene synthase family protein [Rhodospirillales bacterium]|nr:squalene/phytoene synthase family protein [Rhodospirillales bacterium]
MDREAFAEAEAGLRRHDAERWRTTLFAGGEARERLVALYAFNVEIARVRETVSEAILGQIRLQWWREALAEIAAGGPVRKHPVVAALAGARPDVALLTGIVDARERDLDDAPFADLDALEAYARGTSGTLTRAAFAMCGAEGGQAASDIGTAYGLAGMLRSLPHFSRARRCILPDALVAQAGLAHEQIHEGKAGADLARAVEPVALRARELLAKARTAGVPRAAHAAALPGRLATIWLDRLARHAHDAFAGGLQAPHPADIWRLFLANLLGRF